MSGANLVVVVHDVPADRVRSFLRVFPSVLGSLVFHAMLIGAFLLYVSFLQAGHTAIPAQDVRTEPIVADEVEKRTETFEVTEVDPLVREFDTNIQYDVPRKDEVSVPDQVDPAAKVGMVDGSKSKPPVSLPPPGGFGILGQGSPTLTTGPGNSPLLGDRPGGIGLKNVPIEGSFYGRSGATREAALRNGGGTDASEAAVAKGLRWLIRQQHPSGAWSMNAGAESNEIAGTALGLLPFLAAGKTHKAAKGNAYDKRIDRALKFLMRAQDAKGYFTGGMYAHGLATIAICEAYGLTQDPLLRRPAQRAIDLIVAAQNDTDFGWRYSPAKTAQGDLSISGWQIMALKSGMMAGLNVPTRSIDNAKRFLDKSGNPDNGYGYTPGSASAFRMSAVGLLCRQYMNGWGWSNPNLIDGVNKHIKTHSPDTQDVYYYYYATQVMHHFGGEAWRDWNEKMRESLIRKQEKNEKSPNFGSWSPEGDPWARVGGRLMITSLNLLTLEVYYRYLPLYYRDAGYKMDKAVQNSL